MAECIFCRIAAGEVPANVIRRTSDAVAFHDLNPQAPVHALIIPTWHFAALRDARGEEGATALGKLLTFSAEIATELGLDARGYRLVTNTGSDGGQTVSHMHLHLLGGRRMTWPPG